MRFPVGRQSVRWLRRLQCGAAALALVLAVAEPADAQSATEQSSNAQASASASADDEVASENVVVTAPSVDAMVRAFVGEVSNGGQMNQLGRWDHTVCPGVAGMRTQYAQALIDRIAAIAFTVGLDIGEPGCTPNALIYVTENSDALAQELVSQHGALVARRYTYGHTRGRVALQDFANTPRAVRWWHVTTSVSADGFRVEQGDAMGAPSVAARSMGRLRRTTREDFDRVLIIIDARRIDGYRFGAVADYVAMAVLAQLDPAADTAPYDTILNLFADESSTRPSTITDWDLSYLDGLYHATRDARNTGRQERDISRRMRQEVERAPGPEAQQ